MSKKSSAALALIVALLASLRAGPAAAAFHRVPEDHTTIAAALAAAVHSDTVSLAMGTYYEHDLVLPSGVSLVGRSVSPQTVIIDAQNLGRVLVGADLDEQNVLAYFTARAGNSQWWPGAGLFLSGPCTLRNLIVEDCTLSGRGVGAHCTYPALIEDCVFRNNRCTGTESEGGGLHIIPIPLTGSIVRRTSFIGNEAAVGAAIWASASDPLVFDSIEVVQNLGLAAINLYNGEAWAGTRTFLIENSLIAGNSGTGISANASGTVRNCTVADCRSGIVSAGSNASDCYVLIENCVVTGSYDPSGFGGITSWYDGQQGYPDVYCSDVYKNLPTNYSGMFDQTGLNGNISVDPRFCAGAGPEDYPLRKDSPCAPENNTCGVLMGTFPVGCGSTGTQTTSWGHIKSLY